MSKDPSKLKITAPYVRALFDYSVKKNILHQITADFYNLNGLLNNVPELIESLENPTIDQTAKLLTFEKVIKKNVNKDTFNFLSVLIFKNRINLLPSIISSYLETVYKTATIKKVEVVSAISLDQIKKIDLSKKLAKATNSRRILLNVIVDPTLIGGFLIRTNSQIIDFSIKNQLQNLAKHLDIVLDI